MVLWADFAYIVSEDSTALVLVNSKHSAADNIAAVGNTVADSLAVDKVVYIADYYYRT